ncbi:hypothetical protein BKA69DRAFT_144812 [Paraphysoderma sedebokerense]|nr:hypothetical protein BKA69DRAFT_144812 [Paraphysoderma sedebokerense]
MNRSLEHEVNRRTAELEQKTLQLERANIVALEAANAKAVFLSNMSHEIRTPISQVILASELLTETISSVEGKEYANIITSSGRLLLNLVNDILDFSKLESGKVILEEISFNLHGLIQITMDAFSTEKDCRVGHYISEDTPMYVIGDETRLRQILTNLVSNAIKFTNRGFVMLFVTSQHTAEQSYDIQFRIIDTGCGIAADKIDKIFGRFEQEDGSITRKFGGTGLGLSICQNLCHLMGSRLTVQSQPNHGSTFSFTLHFQQAVDPIICSPFFHTVSMQPKVLLLQATSSLFESKSVLAYQLETMGCITECWRLEVYNPPESLPYRLVVVDLVDYNCCHVSLILRVLQSSRAPILLIHSTSQIKFVNEILTDYADQSSNATSDTLIRTLCHPYKQSSLFRVISGLLSEVAMIDSRLDQVKADVTQPKPTHEESTILKSPEESNGDRKIHILLAEDNPINQRIICTMINQLGYTVDVAEDGMIAVQMAREKYYDLILMDVRMPNMNGLEATRQIRSLHYEAGGPFIVGLSADVMSSNIDSGLEAGMDLYMSKPVSRLKLSEVIEQASTMSQQ